MKTTTLVTIILVIAIKVMAFGQTQENSSIPVSNALLPIVKHHTNSKNSSTNQLIIAAQKLDTSSVSANPVEQFSKKIEWINKQISELESLKKEVNEQINSFFVQQQITEASSNYQYSENLTASTSPLNAEEKLAVLHTDLENLNKTCYQSRVLLKKAIGTEKDALRIEILSLEEQLIWKQLEIAIITGKINKDKFEANAELLVLIMQDYQGNLDKIVRAGELVYEANRHMRIASEIRDEGASQLNNAAKLGAYQNAEEKELNAITIQNQAINIFSSNICAN